MKIVAFGASNSKNSINKKLAIYATTYFKNAEIQILDLNDFEMPIFSIDKEIANGHPALAIQFVEHLREADLIIISFAEHNGSYSTAFKNIFDWTSRVNGKVFQDKKLLLMATSPGPRGGTSVLEAAKTRLPFHGANIVGTFSLPEFGKNFSEEEGITHSDYKSDLQEIINNI